MQSDPVDHFHDWPSHPDVLKFQQLRNDKNIFTYARAGIPLVEIFRRTKAWIIADQPEMGLCELLAILKVLPESSCDFEPECMLFM